MDPPYLADLDNDFQIEPSFHLDFGEFVNWDFLSHDEKLDIPQPDGNGSDESKSNSFSTTFSSSADGSVFDSDGKCRPQSTSLTSKDSPTAYVCYDCAISFSKASALKRHYGTRKHCQNSKAGDRASQHTCEECGEVLSRFDVLRRHMQRCHTDALVMSQSPGMFQNVSEDTQHEQGGLGTTLAFRFPLSSIGSQSLHPDHGGISWNDKEQGSEVLPDSASISLNAPDTKGSLQPIHQSSSNHEPLDESILPLGAASNVSRPVGVGRRFDHTSTLEIVDWAAVAQESAKILKAATILQTIFKGSEKFETLAADPRSTRNDIAMSCKIAKARQAVKDTTVPGNFQQVNGAQPRKRLRPEHFRIQKPAPVKRDLVGNRCLQMTRAPSNASSVSAHTNVTTRPLFPCNGSAPQRGARV